MMKSFCYSREDAHMYQCNRCHLLYHINCCAGSDKIECGCARRDELERLQNEDPRMRVESVMAKGNKRLLYNLCC